MAYAAVGRAGRPARAGTWPRRPVSSGSKRSSRWQASTSRARRHASSRSDAPASICCDSPAAIASRYPSGRDLTRASGFPRSKARAGRNSGVHGQFGRRARDDDAVTDPRATAAPERKLISYRTNTSCCAVSGGGGGCWLEAGLQAGDHQCDALLEVGGSVVAGELGGHGAYPGEFAAGRRCRPSRSTSSASSGLSMISCSSSRMCPCRNPKNSR